MALLNLYNLSKFEFRLWLDLHINRWHKHARRQFHEEHRFHILIVEVEDQFASSETLLQLLKGERIESERVAILFPMADEIDRILIDLSIGSMSAGPTNGDASFTIVNSLGMFACLRIPIDYDEIIRKGDRKLDRH